MSEAYDFIAGHGGRDLCSWVRGLAPHWTATCVEAVRPFVVPSPLAPATASWTPYQVELVWQLGLPLDPLGGLPFRVVALHDAANTTTSTPITTNTTATTTTTTRATTTNTTITPTIMTTTTTTTTSTTPTSTMPTTTTATAVASTPAALATTTNSTTTPTTPATLATAAPATTTTAAASGAEDDLTSQSRWWAFVRESLGSVAPTELPGRDSIALRRRTEASEPTMTADLRHVPTAYRALARKILLQHHKLEVQAQKAGLMAPESRDMLGLDCGACPRGAYLRRIEKTLRQAHVWRDHQVTGAVLLLSSPGGHNQRWHRDYATHRYRRNACPLACLLVLDNPEPCRLHIFSKSRVFGQPHFQIVYVRLSECWMSCARACVRSRWSE
jgi:hypothetical protein